jgi:hypothetical protein
MPILFGGHVVLAAPDLTRHCDEQIEPILLVVARFLSFERFEPPQIFERHDGDEFGSRTPNHDAFASGGALNRLVWPGLVTLRCVAHGHSVTQVDSARHARAARVDGRHQTCGGIRGPCVKTQIEDRANPPNSSRTIMDRTVTFGLEAGGVGERLREVSRAPGPFGDQLLRLGRTLLEDIGAGRPVPRRDAVAVVRAVLESQVVRTAEAVPHADDQELLPRLVELLQATIAANSDLNNVGAIDRESCSVPRGKGAPRA